MLRESNKFGNAHVFLKINITRDYLIDFYCHKQKTITSDNVEQLLFEDSSPKIHEDRKITEITEDSQASQTTSDISVDIIPKNKSIASKNPKQDDMDQEVSGSPLLKRQRTIEFATALEKSTLSNASKSGRRKSI